MGGEEAKDSRLTADTNILGPQRLSSQALTFPEELGLLPGAGVVLLKWNTYRAHGTFGTAGHVWFSPLCQDPL